MANSRTSKGERAPEWLRSGPVRVLGRFGAASNATFLVWLGSGEPPEPAADVGELAAEQLAVYKPERGERPLWDFPGGTLHRREVAAYVISEALGWGMVPATVLREDAPHGRGSLQRFVPHDPEQHYFWLLEQGASSRGDGDERLLGQLQRMVVFDLVINNADRKAGHVLLEGEEVRLVDHGVSLHVEDKVRTVAWEFATRPIPEQARRDVASLAEALAGGQRPAEQLAELLAADEIEALIARARRVASSERFPEPTGHRPYPWPLV